MRIENAAETPRFFMPAAGRDASPESVRRFGHLELLRVAANEGEHGALAVAPHAAGQGNVDVDGLPRLISRAFDPETHGVLLTCLDERRGG
jgi:hypothetical protein